MNVLIYMTQYTSKHKKLIMLLMTFLLDYNWFEVNLHQSGRLNKDIIVLRIGQKDLQCNLNGHADVHSFIFLLSNKITFCSLAEK